MEEFLSRKVTYSRGRRKYGKRERDWIWWVLGGCLAVLIVAVISIFVVTWSIDAVSIEKINEVDYSSYVYDQSGAELGRLGAEQQEYLRLEEIEKLNPDLPKAFIKVEDERFYEHRGIDWEGILRAIWSNIKAFGKAEGGGTITMQVARNVLLEDRTKSLTRKLKEMKAARVLEEAYDKRKIIETYMNQIDFGYQVKGVQMASKIYFGKDLTKQKLEPHEMALLAGLPKAPYGYNPFGTAEQRKKALNRRNIVLMKMAEDTTFPALITAKEKEQYQKKDLGVNKKYLNKYLRSKEYGAYKDLVRKEMKERFNINEDQVISEGYQIYTGMNPVAQKAVEQALKDDALFANKENEKLINAGVMMINPQNGLVEAVGGGRNYHAASNNWSLQPLRVESAIQPLTVFAPAVQLRNFNEYTELSFDNRSPVLFGKVVSRSLSEPMVKLLKRDVTIQKSWEYGKRLQLPVTKLDQNVTAMNLGYLKNGTSVKDVAQAYTVFANQGKMVQAHAIVKVLDYQGKEIKPIKGKEIDQNGNPISIFTKKTAWDITRMLKHALENRQGTTYHTMNLVNQYSIAGYSGDWMSKSSGWFIGYTPSLVTAVAVFNDTVNNETGKAKVTEYKIPEKIFNRVMLDTLKGKRIEWFQKPVGMEDPKPSNRGKRG
ncbi:transglycosylase domain-containing protein [Thermoflavimicrobium daqui]|uniref:Uncharacterized protein n=1 Tax=Thermoflavimicrobium daqui TaxID=2137476 RepID=A0A364K3S4_9BACL|nr:transglycosylase domain-containing protein [Thermoflavimicrobium daqui]RAL23454.1 hypothetical protein DL897_12290 [Thermoflavimicrobium daqui]